MTQTYDEPKPQGQTEDMVTNQNNTFQLEPESIKVKPAKLPSLEEQQDKLQDNIIYTSQTSQSSQLQIEKDKKPDESVNTDNLVFDYEDQDDSELSPQSSMRKLCRQARVKAPPQLYKHQQQQQKLIKIEKVERVGMLQEEQVDEDQQEVDSDVEEQRVDQIKQKRLLKSEKLSDLVIFPIPKTKMIRCLVLITNNNFFSLETHFDLYLVQEKRHILRAKKKRFRIYSTFQIFGKEEEQNKAIATIRSNFTRTQYKLIQYQTETELGEMNSGRQVEAFSSDIIKVETVVNHIPKKIIEKQCSYIAYQSNLLGFSQQKLTMLKPRKALIQTERFSDLKAAYQNCEYERVQNFSTRMAQKGPDGKLVLDFKDKSITNSSRNMIIENENSEVGLMFAKFSDDIFILNVMSPFNLLQGFFLGLCNLDRKPFVS